MDLGLKDKVALVTAASKGLGKAVAREFASEGAQVVMCARSELVNAAAEEIRKQTGAKILPLRIDVTKQADIDAMLGSTLDQFGRVDILSKT